MKQKITFLCVMISLFLFVFTVNAQEIVAVQGRVINQGKPVANAKVSLEYLPCKGCLDNITEVMITPQEGLFYQQIEVGVKGVHLIIEEEISKNSFKLIYYPSLALSHLPQYRGISIDTKESKKINLGDVLPTISYKEFSLDLSKYIKDIDDFSEVQFSVKDFIKKKTVVKKRNIPKSFWENSSTVNLALPKDKWILGMQYQNKKNKPVYRSLLVDTTNPLDNQVKVIEL